MEELKVNKADVVKAYNAGSEETKEALVKVFGAEVFKFDYHDIKTYADACEKLGMKEHLLTGSEGGDREAQRQAQALYKLLIIQKAMNNGVWRDKDGWSYYPYWVLYSKEEMERMSEEEKQRKGIKRLLSCAVADRSIRVSAVRMRFIVVRIRIRIVVSPCALTARKQHCMQPSSLRAFSSITTASKLRRANNEMVTCQGTLRATCG